MSHAKKIELQQKLGQAVKQYRDFIESPDYEAADGEARATQMDNEIKSIENRIAQIKALEEKEQRYAQARVDAQGQGQQGEGNDAQERYPDYFEKGQELIDSFSGIDEQYGQYLTDTIMEMDAGPDVFYYLATNPEEAKKIVDAGPRKATIALAKLEAQFVSATPETRAPKIKTTKAPTPPPQLKGSAVARASVPIDTDDLDAFTKALFSNKK